jgi:hypothetical protein
VGSESAPTFGLLDPVYVEGFVEGFLERIGEVDPEEVMLFRDPGEGGDGEDGAECTLQGRAVGS